MRRKILWADDEIDLLKAHVIFLEKKGYDLTPVTNGQDAIDLVKEQTFDAVLLDEMMPGIDGLSVLSEIKNHDPGLPVIMITKSEEEHIMDDALGSRISDYLIKPVNPGQIFTTLKRLLDTQKLRSERVSREYTRQLAMNRQTLAMGQDSQQWAQSHAQLSMWDIEITGYNDEGLQQIHDDQKREFNREFTRYVENNYRSWIEDESGPVLSHRFLDHFVTPQLEEGNKVYFVLIDCFRMDHFLAIESKLEELFYVHRDYYYSILPTATPFCRNALFAGMMPRDITRTYPDIWRLAGHDETGMNSYEPEMLEAYLERSGVRLNHPPHYEKIINNDDAQNFVKKLGSLKNNRMISVVVNFIDFLSHQRSESNILQEIAPDEAAFRSLAKSWFEHSMLLEILRHASSEGATVVITTDHGSVMGERASVVRGDRKTSTNVRYKYGRNLRCEPSEVFKIEDTEAYGLPDVGPATNYLLAKYDYYLVYPNNFRQYEKMFQNSLQHGGISMYEMILPVGVLKPR